MNSKKTTAAPKMNFPEAMETYAFLLMEAAIIERMKRNGNVALHPELLNTPLIYDDAGGNELKRFFDAYIAIAQRAGLPILVCSPTWRANQERLKAAGLTKDVNGDAVKFISSIAAQWKSQGTAVYAGGLTGCRYDSYKPADGLSTHEAEAFHGWQVERLAAQKPDFLMAATMPALPEAEGMARAMAKTDIPYIISFVISKNGRILDNTPLSEAFLQIDDRVSRPPLGYMVNCAYPSFLNPDRQPDTVFSRLIGYQANASALDHAELDGSETLRTEPVSDWGERMIELNRRFGIKILGGCCGTGPGHLNYIVEEMAE